MYSIDDMIQIKLATPNDFLLVKETLTRIGVASKKTKTLYQSCHILHKQSKYAIVHFKEMFLLDGKQSDFSEEDIARRNTIANLIAEWLPGVELVDPKKSQNPVVPVSSLKIIHANEKQDWDLQVKYTLGQKKRFED